MRLYYEESGSGFPLLVIPGGGLNSALASLKTAPFNPMERYKDDFHCVCADLRNALPGQSTGPIQIDQPWDAFSDDQLGLLDHLGIGEFMVIGFCIGGPLIYNLIKRAPDRVVAAAVMQPVGFRPEMPDVMVEHGRDGWASKRSDLRPEKAEELLQNLYKKPADFVFTVTRDFVRQMQTPILIAPDDIPAHPYAVAMETAQLAPHAEVTIYPWKDTPEHTEEVVQHARRFLKSHQKAPAAA